MDFNEWVDKARRAWQDRYAAVGWRLGQTYFNHLYFNRPDIAERIRSTEADPFYSDKRIGVFLDTVAGLWDVEN